MTEPHEPPPWQGKPRNRRGLWIMLALLLAVSACIFFPPVKRKILALLDRLRTERIVIRTETKTETKTVDRIVEKRVEVPVPATPPPLPTEPALGTRKDVAAVFPGMTVASNLVAEEGGRATVERTQDASYAVEFTFKVKVPVPAKSLEDFTGINPSLPTLIPSFKDLLTTAKVSGFYHYLYEQKQKSIQANILRLDRVLTRHNFYDLESVMELENTMTKQKALLIQAEMDVVSDGSDGDRMEKFDDAIFKSQHFQPTTSYAWDKITKKQNPLIPRLEEELREVKDKLKAASLSNTEKAALRGRASDITRVVGELKRRSFLIGQEDPFIVIPLSLRGYRDTHAYTPDIGDYVIVICGDKMMPAIVGDYGPAIKCGEASLRIGKEINPECTPYKRPVSELKVTYLIFPNSAEKKTSAPDYAAWHKQCSDLLTKLGGDAAKLHQWKDRLKKEAPPATPPVPSTTTATATPATPPVPSTTPATATPPAPPEPAKTPATATPPTTPP